MMTADEGGAMCSSYHAVCRVRILFPLKSGAYGALKKLTGEV